MILILSLVLLLTFPCTCAFGQSEPASIDKIPVLTVCEVLRNLGIYNNKSIIVIGKFTATDEGFWLYEDCPTKIVTDGYTWDSSISMLYIIGRTDPPPQLPQNFRWNDEVLLQKMKSSRDYKNPLTREELHARYGRLETRIPPEVFKYPNGSVRGFGFGHLGGSIAQLISCSDCYHKPKVKEQELIDETPSGSR
jgi:hypothetical protein